MAAKKKTKQQKTATKPRARPAKKKVRREKQSARKSPAKKKAAVTKLWQPTAKQQRFVEEYPVDFNGTKAAERAGYSKKTAGQQASRLLKNVKIQAAIQKRIGKLTTKAEVSVERVLSELVKVGFANLQDYIRVTSDGDPYVDLSAMTEYQAAALQEITVEDFKDGRGDDARDVRRVKIKMLDKLSALEKLGKYLSMFVDRLKIEGDLTITKIQRTIVDPKAVKTTKKRKRVRKPR